MILAAFTIGVAAGQSVTPCAADARKPLLFDIPQQSLAAALDSYSATTGIVGLYRAQLAIGRRSKPLAGRYTPDIALTLLLNDTGLTAQYASADAFTLVPTREERRSLKPVAAIARAAVAQQDVMQRDYSTLLQDRISAALCATGVTRPGDYRVALSFRVESTGEIEQFSLLGSSGDIGRDDAISTVLRNLVIGRPAPSHMSQPFTMVVLPASSGGTVDCPPVRSAFRHD